MFDVLKAAPLARLGYHQYTAINNIFEMHMPFPADDHVSGGIMGGEMRTDEDMDKVNDTPEAVKFPKYRTEGV